MAAPAAERPADAVLSEEGIDNPARLSVPRVWIVDPLDGTREFSEPGGADWAVHVAPAVREAGRRSRGPSGARSYVRHASRADAPSFAASPQILVSRTRAPAIALEVRDPLRGTLAEMWKWGRRAPGSPPPCKALLPCTCTPVASTSGTTPRPWRWCGRTVSG